MRTEYDLIVIGTGSGGLSVAKKAIQYDISVAMIDNDFIGGTCVNVGCIPKKIMWYASEFATLNHHAADYGFTWQNQTFDYIKLVTNRQRYIQSMRELYRRQLEKLNIDFIKGNARFLDKHTIQVGDAIIKAKHIVISTGCAPNRPDIKGAEFGIDSNDFFALEKLPGSVVINGAGYIAVELAFILNALGSKVTLLLRYDKLLRHFDSMIGDTIMDVMKKDGIEIVTNYQISEIVKNTNGQLSIHGHHQKEIENIEAILFAIGRSPTSALNLAAAGVKTDENGFVITNKFETTNVKHIYAVGDITGKKQLTPVAVAAGRALAKRVFGGEKNAHLDYKNIPTIIFSHPPAGSIGMSEEEAIDKYGKENIKIHQSQFTSLFYELGNNKIVTRMKLVTLKPKEKILGCHIIGRGVDEMLQGFAVAIKMGATKADFDHTVAIHPTSAEELVTMK